jgi:cytoskeletal protein RodZ
MGRFNKNFLLFMIFACILLLSGCNKIHLGTFNAAEEQTKSETDTDQGNTKTETDEKDNKGNDTDSQKDADSITDTPADSDSGPDTDAASSDADNTLQGTIQPVANAELMIYTINMDNGEIEPKTALIPEDKEITPELIVSTVVESMADQALTVGVDSVTTQDDAVIVSFKSDQPPLVNVGAGIEAAILDAIAQSLTENLKDYSKVIYRVEGKAYASDHFELGINEVYLGDN